jgi:antitoxin component of MazEF toxin-antitoxin module
MDNREMCTKDEVQEVVNSALLLQEELIEKQIKNTVKIELNNVFWRVIGYIGIPLIFALVSVGALYLQVENNTSILNDPTNRFTQEEGDAEKQARETADETLQRQIDNNQASVIKTLDEMKVDIRYIRERLGG